MRMSLLGGQPDSSLIEVAIEGAENSNVLIVPSACSTEASYNRKVPNSIRLFASLGLNPTVLHKFEHKPSKTQIEDGFGENSIIYTLGGHTPTLLQNLREQGTETAMRAAAEDKIVIGNSAGALQVFRQGLVDPSRKGVPGEESLPMYMLDALGIVDAAATVHAQQAGGDRHSARITEFLRHMRDIEGVGFAIEKGAALLVTDTAIMPYSTADKFGVALVESSYGRPTATPLDNDEWIPRTEVGIPYAG